MSRRASLFWIAAAIAAVMGLLNAVALNGGVWVAAWSAVSLACSAHARLDGVDRD